MKKNQNRIGNMGRWALALATAPMLMSARLACAASTWANPGVSSDWTDTNNWVGGVPGGATGVGSGDTATFNANANLTVTPDASRNIKFIVFDTGAGAFDISGGGLVLTNAGGITVNSGVATTETIDTNIKLTTTNNSTATFTNNSSTVGALLVIGGTVTGQPTTQTLNLGGSNNGEINGGITGTATVTKIGTGTWTFNTQNSTYSGPTNIESGTLVANADGPVGGNSVFGSSTTTAINVGDATSITNNFSPTLLIGNTSSIARSIVVGKTTTATTGIYTVGGSNTSGIAHYTGTLKLYQPLTLTAANGGTVDFSTGRWVNSAGDPTIDKAITVTGAGSSVVSLSNTLTTTAAVNVSSGTFTINPTGVLNGTSVAVGVASGATFNVNGSLTKDVTVNGTLGGSGTINGVVTLNGTLAPGNSPGKLTVANAVNFASTAHYAAEVNGKTTAGTDYDQLYISGNHNLALDGTLNVTMGPFDATKGDTVYLVDNAGSGSTGGTFIGLAEDTKVASLNGVNGKDWKITYLADFEGDHANNDVALIAVPEPGSLGLLAIGGLALLRRRRGK